MNFSSFLPFLPAKRGEEPRRAPLPCVHCQNSGRDGVSFRPYPAVRNSFSPVPGRPDRWWWYRFRRYPCESGVPHQPWLPGRLRTTRNTSANRLLSPFRACEFNLPAGPDLSNGHGKNPPLLKGPSAGTRSAGELRPRFPLSAHRVDPSLPRRFRRYRGGPRCSPRRISAGRRRRLSFRQDARRYS